MPSVRYSYLNVYAPTADDSPTRRGAISYIRSGVSYCTPIKQLAYECISLNSSLPIIYECIIDQEADLMLGANVPLPSRYKYVDYPASWVEGPFSILIPIPKSSVNAAAFVHPFTQNVSDFKSGTRPLAHSFGLDQVWIGIAVVIPLTIISLHLATRWYAKVLKDSRPLNNQQVTNQFVNLDGVVLYVLACLVGQGLLLEIILSFARIGMNLMKLISTRF